MGSIAFTPSNLRLGVSARSVSEPLGLHWALESTDCPTVPNPYQNLDIMTSL